MPERKEGVLVSEKKTYTRNPYSIMFGKEPVRNIRRAKLLRQIIDDFSAPEPTMQVYMITGVRGSGKTVFLSDAASYFKRMENWVVVNISSDGNLLEKIISALAAEKKLARIFQNASINLNFFGVGFEVSGAPQLNDPEIALKKMLESLQSQNKRVLITIDEMIRTREVVSFASAFQIYVRENLPVFLLMTGLYENIEELQNVKNLTFLYRAPKLNMDPLNIRLMEEDYVHTLGLEPETALIAARETKGYPYAFQLIGYFLWQNDGNYTPSIRKQWIERLNDYVYDIIWKKLSQKDRYVAYGIASAASHKTQEVLELLRMSQNEFNPYRRRLIKKGLANGDEWGRVTFTLPYFGEFVQHTYEEEMYNFEE